MISNPPSRSSTAREAALSGRTHAMTAATSPVERAQAIRPATASDANLVTGTSRGPCSRSRPHRWRTNRSDPRRSDHRAPPRARRAGREILHGRQVSRWSPQAHGLATGQRQPSPEARAANVRDGRGPRDLATRSAPRTCQPRPGSSNNPSINADRAREARAAPYESDRSPHRHDGAGDRRRGHRVARQGSAARCHWARRGEAGDGVKVGVKICAWRVDECWPAELVVEAPHDGLGESFCASFSPTRFPMRTSLARRQPTGDSVGRCHRGWPAPTHGRIRGSASAGARGWRRRFLDRNAHENTVMIAVAVVDPIVKLTCRRVVVERDVDFGR